MGLSTSAAMAIVLAGLFIGATVIQGPLLNALENRFEAKNDREEITDNYHNTDISIKSASILNNTIIIVGANSGDTILNLSEIGVELNGVIITKNITSIAVNKSTGWIVADKVFPNEYMKITITNITANNGSKISLIGKSGVVAFSTIVTQHPNAVAGQSVVVTEGEKVKFNGSFSSDNTKDFFEWYKPLDWKSYNSDIANYSWTFNDPYSNHTNRNYAYGFEVEHTFSKPNSNGGGISIFDDANQRFRYSITTNDSNNMVSNFIKTIVYFNNVTYLGTENGISRYDIRLHNFMPPLLSKNDTASNFITSMCGDSNGFLYVGTDKGVNVFDSNFNIYNTSVLTESNGLISNYTYSLFVKNGILYVGTDKGVTLYNIIDKVVIGNITTENGLSSNVVKAINAVNNIVFFGTDGGVSRFDVSPGKILRLEHVKNLNTYNGLTSNNIRTLAVKNTTLYIGTDAGVSIFNTSLGTSGAFAPSLTIKNGLTSNDVRSITIGGDIVYIGTDCGIDRLNITKGFLAPILTTTKDMPGLKSNKITSITTITSGYLFIGMEDDSGYSTPYTITLSCKDSNENTNINNLTVWVRDLNSPQLAKPVDVTTHGLRAEYYDNEDFTNLTTLRIDPTINYGLGWNNMLPARMTDGNTFSVRWRGLLKTDYREAYTFYVITDDGIRLWIDNVLIIDSWKEQAPNEHNGTIALSPGWHAIRYDYYQHYGETAARLSWSSESLQREIIPSSHLAPNPDAPFSIDGVNSKNEADEDTPLMFDAATAFTDNVGTLKYAWDFNGDGVWDTPISKDSIRVTHIFTEPNNITEKYDMNSNGQLDGDIFLDTNGNGLLDGEPFIDLNGNCRWDPEPFIDLDRDGKWDYLSRSGLWKSTDRPNPPDYRVGDLCEPFTDWGNRKYDPPEMFTDCRMGSDGNGDFSVYRATDGNGRYDEGEPFIDVNHNGKWDGGESFTDLNGNNKWDSGEPFVDVGNGVWDGESFIDVNGNGYFQDRELINGVWVIGGEPYDDTKNNNGRFDYEEFTDINGNGICDFDEPYIDINGNRKYDFGEPFDDLNGDGMRLTNEFFIDRNGDGMYTLGVDTFLPAFDLNGDDMWTGEPYRDVNGNGICDHELYLDVNGNGRWDGEPFMDINNNGYYDYYGEPHTDRDKDGKFDDLNGMHNFAPTDANGNGMYDIGEPYIMTMVGEPYTDVNGNGVYDIGEPYNDIIKNNKFDPGTGGESPIDLSFPGDLGYGVWNPGNGKWDPGEPYYDMPDINGEYNGKYDIGEPYTDVNGVLNGKYDLGEPYYDLPNDQYGNKMRDPNEPYIDIGSGELYVGGDQAFDESQLFGGVSNTPQLDGDVIYVSRSSPLISQNAENFMMDLLKGPYVESWYKKPFEDIDRDNANKNDGKPYTDVNKNGRYDGIGETLAYDDRDLQYLVGDAFLDTNGNHRLDGDYFVDSNGNYRFDMYNDYLTPANDANGNGKLDGVGYNIVLYAEDEEGNFATVSRETFIKDITSPYADFTAPQPVYEENHLNDSDWDDDGDLDENGTRDYIRNTDTIYTNLGETTTAPVSGECYIDLDKDVDNDADIYSRNFTSDGIMNFKIDTAFDNFDTKEQLNYTWNFGDPYATNKNPNIMYAKFGDTVSHRYTRVGNDEAWNIKNDGTFTVSLTVRDRGGNSYTVSHKVMVFDAEPPKILRLSVTNTQLASWNNFYAYVKDGFAALPQGRSFGIGNDTFFNIEATDNMGITKYLWDFEYHDDDRTGDNREDLRVKGAKPNATWVYYNWMSRDDGSAYDAGEPNDPVFVVRVQVYDAEGNWRAHEFTVKAEQNWNRVAPRK